MSHPFSYVRLLMYGTIQSVQTWSTGVSLWNSAWGNLGNGDLNTWLATLDTAAKAWWTTGAAGLASSNDAAVNYLGIKAEWYDAGSTVAGASSTHAFSAAQPGTSGSHLPTQCSLVVSTLSDNSGRRNRGRMYIPCTGTSLIANSKIASATVDQYVNSTQTWIQALNASSLAGSAPQAVIASNIPVPVAITQLRADNEMDIQRRRADKILGSYTKQVTI